MKSQGSSWRFRFWQLPELFNVELYYGKSVTFDYPRHIHDDYSFSVILSGSDTAYGHGTSFTAYAGDVSLIDAGEVHSSRSDRAEYRIFRIAPEDLRDLGQEIFGGKFTAPHFPREPVKDTYLFRTLLNLHITLEQNASALEQESAFLSTFASLLERQGRMPSTDFSACGGSERIGLIQDYLRSCYADNVSLRKLSSVAGLSPYYMLRVFNREVGCPPHEYQTQLRVSQAKKLMRNGHSIIEAALNTGFSDQSHLSRNFKRIVGVTPGQYLSESNIVQDSDRVRALG